MTAAKEKLDSALITWLDLLSGWAASGELSRAATHVLDLDGEKALPQATGRLKSFEAQWEAGVTQNLPEIVILPEEDMNGALGAYAASTNTIYLSEAFLEEATEEAIQNVLTHELGHFLDAQLNEADTPGEEGDAFERVLNREEVGLNEFNSEPGVGIVDTASGPVEVEQESLNDFVSISFSSQPREGANGFSVGVDINDLYEYTSLYGASPLTWKVLGVDADDLAGGQVSGEIVIPANYWDFYASYRIEFELLSDADQNESFEYELYSPNGELLARLGSQILEEKQLLQKNIDKDLEIGTISTIGSIDIDGAGDIYGSVTWNANTASAFKYDTEGGEIALSGNTYSVYREALTEISENGDIYGAFNVVAGSVNVGLFKEENDFSNSISGGYYVGSNSRIQSFDIDSQGGVIAVGTETTYPASNYYGKIYFFDSDLSLTDAKNLSPSVYQNINDIKISTNGDFYIVGEADRTGTINVTRFSSNGNEAWVTSIGVGYRSVIETDNVGNIYALSGPRSIVSLSENGEILNTYTYASSAEVSAVQLSRLYIYEEALYALSNGTYRTLIQSFDKSLNLISSYEIDESRENIVYNDFLVRKSESGQLEFILGGSSATSSQSVLHSYIAPSLSVFDRITGIFDGPGTVNLNNKGVTPFTLFGGDEINVSDIEVDSLVFGGEDSTIGVAEKKNGTLFAAYEDVNGDEILDLVVKVETSALAGVAPTEPFEVFGSLTDETQVVFGLNESDSINFIA